MNKSNMDDNQYEEIEQSFTLTSNIERIWFWVRDVRLLIIINNFEFEPITMLKGQNTFMKGNEFEGKIFSKHHFKCNVVEVESLPFRKNIKWKGVFESKFVVFFSISLFEVSNTHNTILYCHTEFQKGIRELFQFNALKPSLTNNCTQMAENLKKVLRDSAINLSQFEAGIIRTSMSALWDLITDFKKVKNIAPLSCLDFEYHFDIIQEGCIVKFITSSNNTYLIRIGKINKREESNEWSFSYELIEGAPKIPYRDTTITLKKINKNDCHIAVLTQFLVPCSYEILQEIADKKRYLLHSLKDYLENYQ